PHQLRLALALGDRDAADAVLRAVHRDAAHEPAPAIAVVADRCAAMVNGDTSALRAVADYYRTVARPLELAEALEEGAGLLGRQGETAHARQWLSEAVDAYATLGADWDITRADARARAYGVRRGQRAPHRRATTGWDALTSAEVKVAHLVAKGSSNPEIA